MSLSPSPKKTVGILGFGKLGQHLYTSIRDDPLVSQLMEVIYIWNRTPSILEDHDVPDSLRVTDLSEIVDLNADIVVEVSHPMISVEYACVILEKGKNFVVGSPTCFADMAFESSVREATKVQGNGSLYIPVGALWGASDLQSMANRDGLASLSITMKKHPAMLNITDDALNEQRKALIEKAEKGEAVEPLVLYEGPVRGLCPLAPNNVNTMACCAMSAHSLGFDQTVGKLIADVTLETHEIEILALGKPNASGKQFKLHCSRSSPAPVGAVTSKATYGSFLNSVMKCYGRGPGVHFV